MCLSCSVGQNPQGGGRYLGDNVFYFGFFKKCLRIRQAQQVIMKMSNKVAEKYKVFQDPELIVVGSMKENTKVGEIDEADVTLLMNRRYDKGFFDFDAKNQEIKLYRRYKYNPKEIPEELALFVGENGVFNTTKYFHIFIQEMHEVLKNKSVSLPDGLILSTKYVPCEICKSTEDITPQYIRWMIKKQISAY